LTARVVESFKPPSELVSSIVSPKPNDSFRIFVYGGSTAQGEPTPEFGFVRQLEFWLRELHPDKSLEIYNFAGAGRTSAYARRKVAESITLEPDLLIVLSGHNEFLYRSTESLPNRIVASFALTRSLARKLSRMQAGVSPDNIAEPNYKGYDHNSSVFRQKVQAYSENLADIVETARQHDTPVVLVSAPSNLSNWPPTYQGLANNNHEEQQKKWVQEVGDYLADGLSEAAITGIEKNLAEYPDDALLLYLLGTSYEASGDFEQARSLYLKAKDLDPIPWRVLSQFNQSMRKLAKLEGVYLADAERSFEQHVDHGLVGFTLVVDNCHPTPLGNAIIARSILEVMQRQRLFVESDFELLKVDASLTHFFSRTTTPSTRQLIELAQVLKSAKYSMKTPFHNHKTSRMYLDKALAIDSSNWEIWVNLATLALLENRVDEGRRQLGRAIELRGAPIDENDRGAAPYLKEALAKSGVSLAEFE
ncbi:MAG: GDSL-type esterase/lipase family protein, partial [Gammaproteobacteria bacterium]|nr:GDSL-type esterase/lipase family protein [Gammaproteobacteria bacterium]